MANFVVKKMKYNNRTLMTSNGHTVEQDKRINEMKKKKKIELINNVFTEQKPKAEFKRIKKDKGLIERTERSKITLTEDNKELLKD